MLTQLAKHRRNDHPRRHRASIRIRYRTREVLATSSTRHSSPPDTDNTATMGKKGIIKHQKRLSAPSHWLLDKLSGAYAPKASAGPHKLRDCMPLIVFIRNR